MSISDAGNGFQGPPGEPTDPANSDPPPPTPPAPAPDDVPRPGDVPQLTPFTLDQLAAAFGVAEVYFFNKETGREDTVTLSLSDLEIEGAEGGEPRLVYAELTDEALGIVAADSVEPEAVESLWADRYYFGKLTLDTGDGSTGKSQTATSVVAAKSRDGGTFPMGRRSANRGCA